jgi:hypothetical protein
LQLDFLSGDDPLSLRQFGEPLGDFVGLFQLGLSELLTLEQLLLASNQLFFSFRQFGFSLVNPEPGGANARVEFRLLGVKPRLATVDVCQPLPQSLGKLRRVLCQEARRSGERGVVGFGPWPRRQAKVLFLVSSVYDYGSTSMVSPSGHPRRHWPGLAGAADAMRRVNADLAHRLRRVAVQVPCIARHEEPNTAAHRAHGRTAAATRKVCLLGFIGTPRRQDLSISPDWLYLAPASSAEAGHR